ncbi:ATP-dependent sacrificial sulfur transferase LarE [Neorhodopirellula pilleata]|uniref:tRNA-specific 2-thiouridylase MnmA n=1 Tax=Neorhodopirellula pilleata TaxID=2714738 RepID=A0A5C6A1B4_9BACT|nr:ATP-dependent sacrificial sulfur transferase LarE [Neorhodopirellula pilleata]TWT93041.1 tRNA-specific 2-thiouridylase MnmA [Neorhodopirellula pilleata]
MNKRNELTGTQKLTALTRRLVDHIGSLGPVVVAFSGGVDSSVVAAAAVRARHDRFESGDLDSTERCLAVTARSPSLASWQTDLAIRVAGEIGIKHRFVSTNEQSRDGYRRNHSDRCYYCKSTLYHFLQPIADELNAVILSGTNADDLGDHRPGIQAGREAQVITPLADLHLTKSEVRSIAQELGLSNADLPASPCLASRIEYRVDVTPERLARIDAAESWLRRHGLPDLRVRLHSGELARIEVPRDCFQRVVEMEMNRSLTNQFRQLGFRHVTLDLVGLRSGSMNEGLVQINQVGEKS